MSGGFYCYYIFFPRIFFYLYYILVKQTQSFTPIYYRNKKNTPRWSAYSVFYTLLFSSPVIIFQGVKSNFLCQPLVYDGVKLTVPAVNALARKVMKYALKTLSEINRKTYKFGTLHSLRPPIRTRCV